jgi:hypothetical protein
MTDTSNDETPRGCIDHKVWDDNLRAAFWVLTLMGVFSPLFTRSFFMSVVFILGAIALLVIAAVLDVRHIKWHYEKDEKNK